MECSFLYPDNLLILTFCIFHHIENRAYPPDRSCGESERILRRCFTLQRFDLLTVKGVSCIHQSPSTRR